MSDSPYSRPDAAASLRAALDARLAARDRAGAVSAALDAVHDGSIEIGDLYTGVLGPLLVDTGSAWQRGAERVWEEHFAIGDRAHHRRGAVPRRHAGARRGRMRRAAGASGVPVRRAARPRPSDGRRPVRTCRLGRRLSGRRHADGRDHRRRADARHARRRVVGVDPLQSRAAARRSIDDVQGQLPAYVSPWEAPPSHRIRARIADCCWTSPRSGCRAAGYRIPTGTRISTERLAEHVVVPHRLTLPEQEPGPVGADHPRHRRGHLGDGVRRLDHPVACRPTSWTRRSGPAPRSPSRHSRTATRWSTAPG